ncbi:MAG: hypothetical protein WBG86_20240, partial [Polyangiales bacterium]
PAGPALPSAARLARPIAARRRQADPEELRALGPLGRVQASARLDLEPWGDREDSAAEVRPWADRVQWVDLSGV